MSKERKLTDLEIEIIADKVARQSGMNICKYCARRRLGKCSLSGRCFPEAYGCSRWTVGALLKLKVPLIERGMDNG